MVRNQTSPVAEALVAETARRRVQNVFDSLSFTALDELQRHGHADCVVLNVMDRANEVLAGHDRSELSKRDAALLVICAGLSMLANS